MRIDVFIQNEAGSDQKNYHDEKTLTFIRSRTVASRYPIPYGFVIGTEAEDGANVDCFVLTKRKLSTGETVRCEPIGLMEQFENGVADHNVLAVPVGETTQMTPELEAALSEHVLNCFRDMPEKRVSVGRFLDRQAADTYISRRRSR